MHHKKEKRKQFFFAEPSKYISKCHKRIILTPAIHYDVQCLSTCECTPVVNYCLVFINIVGSTQLEYPVI